MRTRSSSRLIPILSVCMTAYLSVIMGLAFSDAFAAKSSDLGATYYDHAVELIAKGDLRGAVIELKNALQRNPKDLSARVLLGQTYLDLDDGVAAEKELTRARRDGAKDSFVLLPLGRAYLLQGKFDKVIKDITSDGLDEKTAVEITIMRADAELAIRNYRAAEAAYVEASKIRPNDARPLVGLARVKLANDDLNGARLYVKWAISANPDDATAWYFQGEMEEKRNKPDEALKSYDHAIKLAPKFERAYIARAAIRLDRGQYDLAEPDIQTVRKANPRNPRAAYYLSLILAHRGKIKEAQALLGEAEATLKSYPKPYLMASPATVLLAGVVTYFRKDIDTSYRLLSYFLKQMPRHAGARKLLASIALTRNEPKIAMHFLDPLDPRQSKDIEVLTMYGDALMRLKRYTDANIVLKRADKIAAPGSSALFRLVTVRLRGGQNADAIKLLKAELARDPNAVRAATMLGTAQMRAGDYAAALETLDSVTERHPDNAVAHNLAGGALLGLGRVEEARKRYQMAVDASPDYVNAIENLAKVEARLGHLDKAAALFEGILEKHPRNGSVMIALSDIARQRKDMNEAFRWLEKARSSSSEPDAAARRLVDLYIAASRGDDALMAARQLYDRHPGQFDDVLALGRAQLAAKKQDEAVKTFANLAALAAEQKSALHLNIAATWQARALDVPGAMDSLQKALAVDDSYVPTQTKLFTLELSAGSYDAALGRAMKVTALDPASPAGYRMQGDAYMGMGRFAEAVTAYDGALAKDKSADMVDRAYRARHAAGQDGLAFVRVWAKGHADDPISQRVLATAYADSGRLADAIGIYEDLLKKVPNNISILNNVALLYARVGDKRALEYSKRAYDAAPTQPATMDTYGWLLVGHGKVEDGLAILRNAKLRAPDVPEIRYHLAVALNKSGKREEAIKELHAALDHKRPFDGDAAARSLLADLSPPAK